MIRQRPQGDTESPLLPPLSDRQNTPQCSPSRVDGNSTVDRNVHSNQGNPEMNSSPGGHFTHTTELIEPPPSYEYVMSHDFPITTSEIFHSQNDWMEPLIICLRTMLNAICTTNLLTDMLCWFILRCPLQSLRHDQTIARCGSRNHAVMKLRVPLLMLFKGIIQ